MADPNITRIEIHEYALDAGQPGPRLQRLQPGL